MALAGMPLVLLLVAATNVPTEASWPQFRGPNGSGVAATDASPPLEFGPDQNVLWKIPLPPGVSSPCVWGDRIFLTAFAAEGGLETLCFDRRSGRILWRREVPAAEIEKVHKTNSPASATPAANAERVVVYFGSLGLCCYDHEGNELWSLPTPLPKRRFGSGTSPVLAGDVVLLNRDEEPDPQLLAVDARSGAVLWRWSHPVSRGPSSGEGYATPVVSDGLVILHRPDGIAAYNLSDGAKRWWVSSPTTACSTPVVADGTIYVATWNNFGEPDLRADLPPFGELAKKHDRDSDGLLTKDEFPADLPVSRRPGAGETGGGEVLAIWFFDQIDLNKDAKVSPLEWAAAATLVAVMSSRSEHGLLAVRPTGDGDQTGSGIRWREKRYVPEVPSPLAYQGRVYAVKDGGIITCLDAASGKPLFRKRLGAAGSYYASPVAAAGRIYAASHDGVITVIKAGDKFEILARNDLGEPISATPAIVGDVLYVRTAGHLYAFRGM